MHGKPHPSPTHRRFAFTIVELLVVISIVALLISLLLPALSSARDAARTAACLAQYRQVGIAFTTYAAENSGKLPDNETGNPNAIHAAWDGWDFQLAEYMSGSFQNPWPSPSTGRKEQTLKPHPLGMGWQVKKKLDQLSVYCPGYERIPDQRNSMPGPVAGTQVPTWVSFWGVGSMRMNGWLGLYGATIHNNRNWQLPNRYASLYRMTSQTFLMAEGHNTGGMTDKRAFYYNPNHGDRAPTLFVDGRVERLTPDDIPGSAVSWGLSQSAIDDASRSDFWGWYLLRKYEDPQFYSW